MNKTNLTHVLFALAILAMERGVELTCPSNHDKFTQSIHFVFLQRDNYLREANIGMMKRCQCI